MTMTEEQRVGKQRAGWRPDRLREQREAHGLPLEKAGERLRAVAEQAKLKGIPAANPQTLWQHEQGEVFPGPHYRQAYCLLYRATEPDLGFRTALPDEESSFKLTPMDDRLNGSHVLAVERAVHCIAPGSNEADHFDLQQRIIDAWKRRHTGGDPHPVLILVGGFAGSGKTELARFFVQLTGWPLLDTNRIGVSRRDRGDVPCSDNRRKGEGPADDARGPCGNPRVGAPGPAAEDLPGRWSRHDAGYPCPPTGTHQGARRGSDDFVAPAWRPFLLPSAVRLWAHLFPARGRDAIGVEGGAR
ncbi:hypothetical protein ACIPPJ_30120 [Streptomyces sp. NPDC086091]|uniref:hypothetical protein n=1 Tax=Streptomyces sp. NPDC086091 TaxID=3365751 RepID=UPI003829B829